jgi:hypothetical protein
MEVVNHYTSEMRDKEMLKESEKIMSQRQLSVTVYKEKECLEDQRLQWE